MIEFTQTISDGDYKWAIAEHYFGYKYTYVVPVLGVLLILGLLTGAVFFEGLFPETPILLYVGAIIMVIRPVFYIYNVFNSIKTDKFSSSEVSVKVTDDNKIITSTNGNMSSFSLIDLYAYYDTRKFLFLNLSRNQYLILDKRQFTGSNNLIRVLILLKVKER
jgi:hypothetical protein